jgi:predicted NACHT family NTPase
VAERLELSGPDAQRLPIFVPLAAYDDMLRRTPNLSLVNFLEAYYDLYRGLPRLGPLFAHALESGQALVLLDGLDEVVEAGTRQFVAQQVAALIGEWLPAGNRIIVTSRFYSYREAPLPGDFPHYSLLEAVIQLCGRNLGRPWSIKRIEHPAKLPGRLILLR